MIVLGEVIQLLHLQNRKVIFDDTITDNSSDKTTDTTLKVEDYHLNELSSANENIKQAIRKNTPSEETIIEVFETPVKNHYILQLEDKIKFIQLVGYLPITLNMQSIKDDARLNDFYNQIKK